MKAVRFFVIIYASAVLLAAVVGLEAQTCVPASNAAGAFDTCFDGDGKVLTNIAPGGGFATATAVQPDRKIVAAGVAVLTLGGVDSDFAVVRYNENGSLDISFGGDGIVTTDVGTGTNDADRIEAVAIQPDGKIVVAGYGLIPGSSYAIFTARYNADGSLDTTFDTDGIAQYTTSNVGMYPHGIIIQPDGKIVVGAHFLAFDNSFSLVLRYNANGSLDNSFDGDGSLIGTLRSAYGIHLQGERIIIVGTQNFGVIAVARLNSNGSLDTSFGTGGFATYQTSNALSPWGTALRNDGSVFVAATFSVMQTSMVDFIRFNPNGTLGAQAVYSNDNVLWSLAIQPDAKVVSAGRITNPEWGFVIRRFTDANMPDATFGGGAVNVKFLPPQTAESANVSEAAITRDAKIVAVGASAPQTEPTTPGSFAVTRIMSGLAPRPTAFDFDGDEKADISVYRASERKWYIFRSSDFGVTIRVFGEAHDTPAPADYDGDRKTDFGLFYQGNWMYLSSINGSFNNFSQIGTLLTDIPRPSDFNGDGRSDGVAFIPPLGQWFRVSSEGGDTSVVQFGLSSDKPLTGDFDGDGKSDAAIFRPSTGDWWWLSSADGVGRAAHWGISTDKPVPADYDNDGRTDFAVYRPSEGVWYIYNSSDGSFTILQFGLAEDKPVPADYDGDGRADIAVFRPSTGVWYLLQSTQGFLQMQFGISTDVPLPGVYVP